MRRHAKRNFAFLLEGDAIFRMSSVKWVAPRRGVDIEQGRQRARCATRLHTVWQARRQEHFKAYNKAIQYTLFAASARQMYLQNQIVICSNLF